MGIIWNLRALKSVGMSTAVCCAILVSGCKQQEIVEERAPESSQPKDVTVVDTPAVQAEPVEVTPQATPVQEAITPATTPVPSEAEAVTPAPTSAAIASDTPVPAATPVQTPVKTPNLAMTPTPHPDPEKEAAIQKKNAEASQSEMNEKSR